MPDPNSTEPPIKLVVVVSDIHCGSTVGLLPPDFETVEGQHVRQNKFQQWLWQCWTDATEDWLPDIIGDDPWAFVSNGDSVEGQHHRTTQIISGDVADHKKAASEVLLPLAEKARKRFMVRGTECHTGSQNESSIGKDIGAERNPENNTRAFDRLILDVHGCRSVFRHHVDATSRTYLEATQLSVHLALEQLEPARVGHPIPKLLVCAHRHRFGMYTDSRGMCIVCGPWQGLTRHGHKVVSAAVCKPTIMVLDWRNVPWGSLPIVHAQQYTPPAPEAIQL